MIIPGLSLGRSHRGTSDVAAEAVAWQFPDALIDLDYENDRYYYDGEYYASYGPVTASFRFLR